MCSGPTWAAAGGPQPPEKVAGSPPTTKPTGTLGAHYPAAV